jgi:hypothetical protein
MPVDQAYLNKYFGSIWSKRERSLDQYAKSGYALGEYVRPGERVIDVGCGKNPFRGFIPNLIGVDPVFDEADYKMTIEEFAVAYKIHKFNIAFCLGSINFGAKDDIERQIALVVSLLREQDSRIYWRCNPGLADHGNQEFEHIPVYPWSFDEQIRLAEKFNFTILEMCWDTPNRIYSAWISKNTVGLNIV